ncbi:MAG: ABC transporter substrate-binding protein, partial [Acetobacteraceae bacterium]
AFGKQLGQDVTDVVTKAGGQVLGSSWHPLNAKDFSAYLLTAQSSKADVVALCNAGADTTNAIKQAAEFGLSRGGQRIAAMIFFASDAKSLGLPVAQGISVTTAFYHDQNAATRAWSDRFYKQVGAMPSMLQAGVYGSVAHYLKAVNAAGTADSGPVLARMHATPINDFMSDNCRIREDGHVMRDMYLARVKTPAESHDPWDVFTIVRTIPAAEVVWPLSQSRCPLVKKT